MPCFYLALMLHYVCIVCSHLVATFTCYTSILINITNVVECIRSRSNIVHVLVMLQVAAAPYVRCVIIACVVIYCVLLYVRKYEHNRNHTDSKEHYFIVPSFSLKYSFNFRLRKSFVVYFLNNIFSL